MSPGINLLSASTLVLLNPNMPCLCKNVDPDQLASEDATWSAAALLVIYVSLHQQSGVSDLNGWHLDMGVAS